MGRKCQIENSIRAIRIADSSVENTGSYVNAHRTGRILIIYERLELKSFERFGNSSGRGVLALATVEDQTHFVLNAAVACDGYRHGIRDFGDRLEIPADSLRAPGNGSHFLRNRPHRRNDPRGGVAQAAAGDLDRFTSWLAKNFYAGRRTAADLCADVPVGQGYGGL